MKLKIKERFTKIVDSSTIFFRILLGIPVFLARGASAIILRYPIYISRLNWDCPEYFKLYLFSFAAIYPSSSRRVTAERDSCAVVTLYLCSLMRCYFIVPLINKLRESHVRESNDSRSGHYFAIVSSRWFLEQASILLEKKFYVLWSYLQLVSGYLENFWLD